ncbi:hypothetical protein [Fusibacter sp. JL216-2]|uniref:hypothetical protein n=1 Tax=Fusibacter sp. JL216-2 TaxID=3071453 RepID=UPI003D32887F
MIRSYNVIIKLIDRYDYGGALELLSEIGLENSDAAVLMDSCRYAVNFDFKTARHLLYNLTEEYENSKDISELKDNLQELIDGDPDAMFSELLENTKFQIVNEEYIDFLSRVYRFKEAIFKYMFVEQHLNRSRFTFMQPMMQKRQILKTLRKKYKIFNSNLIFGITTYFNRYHKDDYTCQEVVHIMNAEKMMNLIELRNDSIVGHGFSSVSIEDIYKYYGNPYNVLDDFRLCVEKLEIKINRYKYSKINDMIREQLDELNRSYIPNYTGKAYLFE